MSINWDRNLDFLYEIGSMRNMDRGWKRNLGVRCATVLEHTNRVIWLALILARAEGVEDEEKVMKMALVHDLAETRVTDHSYVAKVYVKTDEERAVNDTLADTSLQDLKHILNEYESRDNIEAKIVKDADNLDVDLELKELEEQGSQLPRKWINFRKLIREEKLYTQSAKDLWDYLQDKDLADWHLNSNKWLKIKDAGL